MGRWFGSFVMLVAVGALMPVVASPAAAEASHGVGLLADDASADSVDLTLEAPGTARIDRPTVLSGRVTFRGEAVGQAELTLTTPDGELLGATTGDDGVYAVAYTPREGGTFVVRVAGDGERPAAVLSRSLGFERLGASISADGPAVTAPREPIVYTGSLTWEGEPLVGEEIEVASNCPLQYDDVTTGADGRWSVSVAAPRCTRTDFAFRFHGNRFAGPAVARATTATTWHQSRGQVTPAQASIGVDEPVTFTGTLLVDDVPAADRAIAWRVQDERGVEVRNVDARTDASGRTTLAFVPSAAGQYRVVLGYLGDAETLGTTSGSALVTVTREKTDLQLAGPQQVPADQPKELTGRLTDADGVPLPGRTLRVIRSDAGGTTELSPVTSDDDGRFTVLDVETGRGSSYAYYEVRFAGDRTHAPRSVKHMVDAYKVGSVLTLESPEQVSSGEVVRVTGRLVNTFGRPIRGAAIEFEAQHDSGSPAVAGRVLTTDDEGRFSTEVPVDRPARWSFHAFFSPGTTASDYFPDTASTSTLVAAHPGRMTLLPREESWVPGNEVVLDGTLTRVDGTPEVTTVVVERISGAGEKVGLEDVRTAIDGSFTVRDTPPGEGTWTYRVTSVERTVVSQVVETTVEVSDVVLPPEPVQTGVTTEAVRSLRTSGRYAVFGADRDPTIRGSVTPAEAGRCVSFEVQRWRRESWSTVDRTDCVASTARGRAEHRMSLRHPAGTRWRVRAHVEESDTATAAVGRWTLVRFVRPAAVRR